MIQQILLEKSQGHSMALNMGAMLLAIACMHMCNLHVCEENLRDAVQDYKVVISPLSTWSRPDLSIVCQQQHLHQESCICTDSKSFKRLVIFHFPLQLDVVLYNAAAVDVHHQRIKWSHGVETIWVWASLSQSVQELSRPRHEYHEQCGFFSTIL